MESIGLFVSSSSLAGSLFSSLVSSGFGVFSPVLSDGTSVVGVSVTGLFVTGLFGDDVFW